MTLRRVAIAVVVLGVLGGIALFVLDNTIFAPVAVSTGAPVAATLAAPTLEPAGAVAPSAESAAGEPASTQLYRIDATQSEVRYEVGETLFRNNRFATAIGRTQSIAGDILVDFDQPAGSQIGEVVIDVSQFTSDETRRDNFIRRSWLESARFPYARFVTRAIDGLPSQVSVGDEVAFTISGDLTVKETTLPVTWSVTLQLEDNRLVGSASTEILMSQFGVGPIRIPTLETEDLVKLFFEFVAVPVES
jgi:polyisoprenoid-binding protein YceI